MSNQLSTTQTVKQTTRRFTAKASDKMKLASSAVARGDTRELDVAVIKATTSQFHVVPKEKHVRTLRALIQTGGKDHVREVIRELMERLKSATDWLTALKCLIVFHRLMRECGSTFLNALVQYGNFSSSKGKTGGILDMGNFLDTTNIDGRFDFSEWVRGYGRYLDEQLEVYKELNYYPEMENGGETSRMRTLSGEQLLTQLPVLQRLQQRLMDCRPGGAAAHDHVVQGALLAVLKESFKIYKAVSEGIINLADRFFEMEYLEAYKGLEVYKESIVDNAKLQEYYQQIERIEGLKQAIQFPKLENLPPDFLTQMEEYVKEAPRNVENVASAPKKKTSPLRKGSKAGASPKPALKVETPALDTGSSDPGMVTNASKAQEASAEPVQKPQEPNLLDFEDLSVNDAPASSQAPASQAVPSHNDDDPFGGALQHPDLANNNTNPPVASTSFTSSDPFATSTAPQSTSSAQPYVNNTSRNNTSGQPQANPYANSPNPSAQSLYGNPTGQQQPQFQPANHQQQSQGSRDPFASSANSFPPQGFSQPSANNFSPQGFSQPTANNFSPQGFGQPTANNFSPQGFGQPAASRQPGPSTQYFAPKGGAPMNPGMQANGFAPAQSQQRPMLSQPLPSPSWEGASQFSSASTAPSTSGFGRELAQESQLAEFHGGARPNAAQAAPRPAESPALAAGLTRPTNTALAKEAALHDPFASLAQLKPSNAPKYSPPLKQRQPLGQGVGLPGQNPTGQTAQQSFFPPPAQYQGGNGNWNPTTLRP